MWRKQTLMRLNAPAYRYRITRLQYIRQSIMTELSRAADAEKRISTECYTATLQNAYARTMYEIQKGAGVGFGFTQLPQSAINRLLSAQWYGRNYAASVWRNRGLVAKAAGDVVKEGVLSGQSVREMSKALMERTYTASMANATRLVRTEVNYFCNQGELASYREVGIEEYEFLATLDLRTSQVCREHDGHRYRVEEAIVGENCPPLHPYCRGTTVAVIDLSGIDRMNRWAARNSNGKTVNIENMSYPEWRNQFTKGAGSGILDPSSGNGGNPDVHFVGRINREIYHVVTEDITTDEVVITDRQIEHIRERHPNDFERYQKYLTEIVESPDYILQDRPNTAFVLKQFVEDEEQFELILRLKTSVDPEDYKNSIITFLKLKKNRYDQYLRNRKILYKKE